MTTLRFGRALGRAGAWPPSLHDVLWWTLALAIVVAAVRLLWIAVTPLSPLGAWEPAGVRLMDDAARSALLTGFDPFNRAESAVAVAAGPEVVTDLPLTLFGVLIDNRTGSGSAIIAGADGEQAIYRLGEEVTDGATLADLAFDHVVLGRGGARELLYLDQSQPAQRVAPATPAVAAPAAAGNPLSASALRSGIAANPRAGEGGVVGIEVAPRGDGASFRAAGLRSGDVVVAVDGRSITGSADVARLTGSLAPGKSLSLTVLRDGKQVPLSLEVAP